jgi:DnaJ-class molecular chaperone
VLLRGLGLPSLRGAARGDHHVVVDVHVPAARRGEQRELAERLDEALGGEAQVSDGGAARGAGGRSRWRPRRTARG